MKNTVLDFLVIFSYSSVTMVTGDVLDKEALKLFDKSGTYCFLRSRYCHECAESDANYIHPQFSHNRIVLSKYNLLMSGIKIILNIFLHPTKNA